MAGLIEQHNALVRRELGRFRGRELRAERGRRPLPGHIRRPGEVLASSTVKDLVAGSGLEFEDRGSHELKGVPGEWRVYAVAGA